MVAKTIYPLASRDLVSLPFWVNSVSDDMIGDVVDVEVEKLGVKTGAGPGRIVEWKAVDCVDQRTLVQAVAIPWEINDDAGNFDGVEGFVPRYELVAAPDDAVALWKEEGNWVVGFSRNGEWAHVENLGASLLKSVVDEIHLIALELTTREIVPRLRKCIVWADCDASLLARLESILDLEVVAEIRPAMRTLSGKASSWRLEPDLVAADRLRRKAHRRTALAGALGCLLVAATIVAAFAHLSLLEHENQLMRNRIEMSREDATLVKNAIEKWEALSPALDPQRSPVEIFHQVALVFPDKGFRITSFEIKDYGIVSLRCEGVAMAGALKIKGLLETSEALNDYEWEVPPPQKKGEFIELVATGNYRF